MTPLRAIPLLAVLLSITAFLRPLSANGAVAYRCPCFMNNARKKKVRLIEAVSQRN